MREDNGAQGVGATAFDLANNQNPRPRSPIHYGDQHVPTPTNKEAMQVPREAIIRSFTEGK